MGEAERHLVALGFSEYEARAYVGLARFGPLTGYELAKRTGLPRPNVYAVLARLEERGAVIRAAGPEGQRYAAVPGRELVAAIESQVTRSLEQARAALEQLEAPAEDSVLWNLRGRAGVLDQARTQVRESQHALWLAISPPEAAELAEDVADAEARGVRVETLCLEGCPEECGGCRGTVYRYRVPPERTRRWLVVVRDQADLLAAEIDPQGHAVGVRTRNALFVQLVTWYMRYSVALAQALEAAGVPRNSMASLEAAVRRLAARGRAPGWLRHLARVLRAEPP